MKPVIFFICVIVMVIGSSCNKEKADVDCNVYPVPSDTYKYSILPGTPAWANLKTGDERLQACQIPDSVLPRISTGGLVQSWLDMPLNNEILMTNSLQKAIEYFIEKFSGLRELVGRKDAADKLLARYQSMNPACVSTFKTDIEQGSFTFSFSYIELPLAQDTILNQMTLKQKKILINEALKKYKYRTDHLEYYDVMTANISLFICARVMRNCQYQPFLSSMNDDLLWFINNAQFKMPLDGYATEINIIISNSKKFIQ